MVFTSYLSSYLQETKVVAAAAAIIITAATIIKEHNFIAAERGQTITEVVPPECHKPATTAIIIAGLAVKDETCLEENFVPAIVIIKPAIATTTIHTITSAITVDFQTKIAIEVSIIINFNASIIIIAMKIVVAPDPKRNWGL